MASEGRPPPSPVFEGDEDVDVTYYGRRRCCCYFWIPWNSAASPPPPAADWWTRMRSPDRAGADEGGGSRWWRSALMRVREWSELVAGPRWKTFIRRFNRGRGGGGAPFRRFQYDQLSYSLNFDEQSGGGAMSHDEDALLRNFSARFAPPVRPADRDGDGDCAGL